MLTPGGTDVYRRLFVTIGADRDPQLSMEFQRPINELRTKCRGSTASADSHTAFVLHTCASPQPHGTHYNAPYSEHTRRPDSPQKWTPGRLAHRERKRRPPWAPAQCGRPGRVGLGPFAGVLAAAVPTARQGGVTYVTEGMLRIIHRQLANKAMKPYADPVPYRTFRKADARPLMSGEVAELVFDLLPTSYLFKRGHSIRVAIAGADRDHFALIPADGPLTLRFFRSIHRPSRIELPIVER
jgi:X-Pro dipeptidyl-peptidase C-terminal non-catalytic domain